MLKVQYLAIVLPVTLLTSCSGEKLDNVGEHGSLATAKSPCVREPEVLSRIGDVNNDGNVDRADVDDISKFLSAKPVHPFNKVVADVNRDGVINAQDKALVHRYVNGQLATFPVQDVDVLVSQMTLREKVGQMILVEQQAIFMDRFLAPVEEGGVGWTWLPDREVDLEDVKDYGFGAFFSGGDSVPYKVQRMYNGNDEFNLDKVPVYYHEMYQAVQAEALQTRLMIPVMYGVDTVHGYGGVRGATIFPHNIGMGATRDAQLVRKVGEAVAAEVTNCAVDWVFSPAVSVVDDVRWGRTYEGFSENTQLVSELAVAYVDGYQGSHYGQKNRVLATAKHFLGDGGVKFGTGIRTKQNVHSFSGQDWGIYADSWGDSYATLGNGGFFLDQGDTQCTEAELRSRFLPPYRAAIARAKQEVASVMVSHSSWNGIKSHANYHLITETLKGELGFSGLVVSDWESPAQNDASYLDNPYHRNNVDQLNANLNEFTDDELRDSINAGLDMLMLPSLWMSWSVVDRTVDGAAVPGVISRIINLVEQGQIAEARINDAARRILLAKKRRGLFDDPIPETPKQTVLGSRAHRELAREAVRKSAVLLKNQQQVLPIAKSTQRIHVAGKKADNLGIQCGGWTLTWQGQFGDFAEGNTILEAVRGAVSSNTTVTYTEDGTGAAGADVAVVVVGEIPYAEWHGDAGDGYHPWKLYQDDLQTIANVKASGTPVVVVLISGRPIDIHEEIGKWDALLAVWLPGTQGEGVTDVLFGDYNPTGKLPYTWPETQANIPIHSSNPSEPGVLFPYGFGLRY